MIVWRDAGVRTVTVTMKIRTEYLLLPETIVLELMLQMNYKKELMIEGN